MQSRFSLGFVLLVIATAMNASLALAQDQTPDQKSQPTKIEHNAAASTSPASGHEMYMSYCAPCHGKSGKGDGPAASALKVAPADLTMLAKNNGGKYPANKVSSILNGQTDLAAHGNKEMPVWGNVFWKMSGGHESEVQQRIANLNHYVQSLQVK